MQSRAYRAAPRQLQPSDLTSLAAFHRALADETRLRILGLLAHHELCVCHIHVLLGVSQPHASRHLAVLRTAGVLSSRREGVWVYYRVAQQYDPLCEEQLQGILRSFREDHVTAARVRAALAKAKLPCEATATPSVRR